MSVARLQRQICEGPDADFVEESYPLSPMQQGMLFHSLYAKQSGVNIEQVVLTLHEDLNVLAFMLAWQRVVDRHAIMRSSFRWEGLDEPLQAVYCTAILEWQREDWRGLSENEQGHRLETYLTDDRAREFTFNERTLNRMALLRTGYARYKFVWTFHHAIIDGRSLVIILKEAFAYYNALGKSRTLALPRSRPYRDYIEWLGDQDLSASEIYWREALRGFTSPTLLAIDREADGAGPEGAAFAASRYKEQEITLAASVTSRLRRLAEESGITLNTLVQGAWALILSRYSGEEEVVFGATRRCRRSSLADADSIVGLFINTLPMKVTVSGARRLLPWLKEIRAQHVALRKVEHTPLIKIQEWSEVPNGRPLFDSILIFEGYELNSFLQSLGEDWKSREFEIHEQPTYPMELSAWAGEELLFRLSYDCRRFDDGAITRLLGGLATLLKAIAVNPDQRLASLSLLDAQERRRLLVEWNATAAAYSENACVHHLFELQADRTPEATAVVFNGESLSYGQLNERANQLARRLVDLGVGPDVLVAVCMNRSLDMIVSLLAALKAGGAYLPLDPSSPADHLTVILRDARPRVVLAEKSLLERLSNCEARVITVDSERELTNQQEKHNLGVEVKADNLAYVIYTSGSTGMPKGVLIEHRSLVNYSQFAGSYYALGPGDRVLQFASISFDASAEEIYACLTRGATLVLRTEDMASSISSFLEKCDEWRITVLDLPTAYWHEMAAAVSSEGLVLPAKLRLIIIGGESASAEKLRQWQKRVGKNVRLVNTYGPTEATIVTTVCDLTGCEESILNLKSVSIGRPVSNAQVYILDRDGQPVPVGVPGELCIGGAGLARGYLNRPELTRERFVPNPFDGCEGGRLYKTGDLARYLSDGNIEFCGRADDQVKIHGFRIELGEIEAVIARSSIASSAVVSAREDAPGDKRLVAYIVPAPHIAELDQQEIAARLREFLTSKLPHYMIPSAFVILESLPVSRNGKVNRRMLPAPGVQKEAAGGAYVRPRNPLEYQLVEIWEELFQIRPIGIKDSFFDLGGHSLLSVRIMDRVERLFGKKVPLATLFEGATIEYLADALVNQVERHEDSPLVPIQPCGTKRPFYYLHGDFNGGGLYCSSLARHLGKDQPFYALQPHGLNDEAVPPTIEEMAAHHIKTLREFQPEGPYLLGGHCNGGLIAFEMARQLAERGERIDLLALICTTGDNARFHALHRLLNGYYWLRGFDDCERQERFLVWRRCIERIGEIRDYYKARLNEISRVGPREQIAALCLSASRIKSLLRNISYTFSSSPENDTVLPEAETDPAEGRRKKVMDAYVKAMAAYVPRPYKGRMTLLLPAESSSEPSYDPAWGWRSVTDNVEVRVVPGGHLTCITSHVKELAENLSDFLNRP
ncbi:MAG TPA: amino acid adenylation domain-containing protein [Blastocatellia bacterium]|nr:amino acid adenylation domain-containing protein [Blastocatellia bacterium]